MHRQICNSNCLALHSSSVREVLLQVIPERPVWVQSRRWTCLPAAEPQRTSSRIVKRALEAPMIRTAQVSALERWWSGIGWLESFKASSSHRHNRLSPINPGFISDISVSFLATASLSGSAPEKTSFSLSLTSSSGRSSSLSFDRSSSLFGSIVRSWNSRP